MSSPLGLSEFVCSTIAQACNRPSYSVSLEANMLELNMDSLTLVSVLAQVEAVYEVELTPDETLRLIEASRVSELIDQLEQIVSQP